MPTWANAQLRPEVAGERFLGSRPRVRFNHRRRHTTPYRDTQNIHPPEQSLLRVPEAFSVAGTTDQSCWFPAILAVPAAVAVNWLCAASAHPCPGL